MKITISGLAGTGKSTLARLLAQELGYEYMSGGNIFRTMAEEQGMTIEEFDHFVVGEGKKFDKELDMRQKEYGEKHDNFVFESRLGWYFIPDAFKVKLECDLDERIRRITQDDSGRAAHTHGNFEETKKKTLAREATYSRYDTLYGIAEWNDDAHYDMVIDTTETDAIGVADLILQELRENKLVEKNES